MNENKLYYIKGNAERGDEVIKTLLEKYPEAYNIYELTGIDINNIYYVGKNKIYKCHNYSDTALLIQTYGTELHLPEKLKVLSWDDIKGSQGYLVGINNTEKEFCPNKSVLIYATKEQAKSAQAAAMISQIREQGKDTYGEIVENNKQAYIMYYFYDTIQIDPCFGGGLLRFSTKEQAELFLENNEELVEQYLKTF